MGERNPTEYEELAITKVKHGGFIVRHLGYGGNMTTELFASSDIGEALNFVRAQLMGRPVAAEAIGETREELMEWAGQKPAVIR
jgi:hypothetical protein